MNKHGTKQDAVECKGWCVNHDGQILPVMTLPTLGFLAMIENKQQRLRMVAEHQQQTHCFAAMLKMKTIIFKAK